MRIRLGELLLRARVIDAEQLQAALLEQARWGERLGQTLVRMGYLTEDLLVKALSRQLGFPRVDLRRSVPTPEALGRLRREVAQRYGALPLELRDDGATLVVAMVEPQDVEIVDSLKVASGCRRIEVYLAGETELRRYLALHYGGADLSEVEASDDLNLFDLEGTASPRPHEGTGAPDIGSLREHPGPALDGLLEVLFRIEREQARQGALLERLAERLDQAAGVPPRRTG